MAVFDKTVFDKTELKRRLVLDPKDHEARYGWAEVLFAENDFGEARKHLEKLLQAVPTHANALRLLARACKALGEAGASTRALQRLVDLAPDDSDAHETLAHSYAEDHRPDDSLFYAQLAAIRGVFAPQRHLRCAELAAGTGRLALARAWTERGLLQSPDAELGLFRRRLLEELAAEDEFDLLQGLFRSDPLAAVRWALEREDLAGARKQLVTLAAEHDGRPEFQLLRGELLLLEDQADRARSSFDKARSRSPVPLVTGALAQTIKRGSLRRLGVLGWNPHGGSVSPLECVAVPGTGKLHVSGNVKDTGLDAGQLAFSLIKREATRWKLTALARTDIQLNYTDIHATKDGLSSGLAITLAMHHAILGTRIPPRVAVTGAVSLGGDVLRIAGVHEKTLAAFFDGARVLIAPKGNKADVDAVHPLIRDSFSIHLVSTVDEALAVLGELA